MHPLRINLQGVFNERLGRANRYIPRSFVRRLERLIRVKDLNTLLKVAYPKRGGDFCRAVLKTLNIRLKIKHPERLPAPDDRRVIFVSNHPLGSIDGVSLIDLFTRLYHDKLRVVVNDLLMSIEPLSDVFLPVNKHGRQNRAGISAIDDAMASDNVILVFPAGYVSRRRNGKIEDTVWHKMFVNKAIEYKRDIIPLYYRGQLSNSFYRWCRFRERLGMKFNAEMVLLPREIFRLRNKTFSVTCGERIPYTELKGGTKALAQAQDIKKYVYQLGSCS